MKKTLLLLACLGIVISSSAQLKVDSAGHVSIATTLSNIKPRLAVGSDCLNDVCIGVSAAPVLRRSTGYALSGTRGSASDSVRYHAAHADRNPALSSRG